MNNLNNQGLSEVTVTSGTAKYKTGKIGQGFDLSSRVMFNCPDLSGCKKFTVCFWAKIEDDANITTNWQDIIGFTNQKADNSSTGQLRAETHYTSAATDSLRYIHWHDNQTNAFSDFTVYHTANGDTQRNVWHHCVLAMDSENGIWAYTDGEPRTISGGTVMNGGHLTGQFWLGETNNIQGVINDVRVYKDEILSPKVIKEISKGLVCHYTLSNGGGENLIKNSTLSNDTDSWIGGGTPLTSENTTYNSVGCWHVVGELQKYKTLTPYFTVNSTRYLGVQTAGNQYVLSMDVLFENVVKGTTNYYVTLYKNGETINGTWRIPTVVNNSGHFTYTNGDNLDPSKLNGKGWQRVWIAVEFGDYNWSNANYFFQLYFRDFTGDIYIKNVKIEKGSVATPWTPNSADPEYTQMGFDDGIEYDVSGYGHNGTKTGTITYDTDTPRYWTSSYFNGSSYIISESPCTEVSSISLWVKTSSTNNAPVIIDFKSGLSFGFFNHLIVLANSGGNLNTSCYPITDYKINQWNHVAIVKSGATDILCYINGVLQTKTSTTDHWSGSVSDKLSIAARSNGSTPAAMTVSDVRLYATTLSADDILAIYNTPISLTSNGTLLTQGELTEV